MSAEEIMTPEQFLLLIIGTWPTMREKYLKVCPTTPLLEYFIRQFCFLEITWILDEIVDI